MKTYLIFLKLNLNEELYANLIAYLKTATYWARPSPGIWLIKVSNTSSKLRDDIRARVNRGDKVLVIEITNQNWATLSIDTKVTDWMKKNI